jgi:hypothetical protein
MNAEAILGSFAGLILGILGTYVTFYVRGALARHLISLNCASE